MDAWVIRGLVSLKDDASNVLDRVQGKFNGTNQVVEGSTSRMGNVLSKVSKAIVGAFTVKKVIDFGKQIVETTSEVGAMKSQFDQVFKQDAGNALDKIKGQSKELNIHADRLQGTWNKFGAQIKGVGTEGPKAIGMTEKATRLAADAAAYFDKDMSTASDSLASFMKGNFQAGDALGVFTNANDMSRYSMGKLGKKWQDLTEAQKQDMLLQKVEETYKLNGAMGQAAREANNWSNVTGNLKATWDNFLAKIGGPLLSVATKGVKLLTDGIGWLGDKLTSVDFGKLAESNPVLMALKDTFTQVYDAAKQIFEQIDWQGLGNTISNVFTTVGDILQSIFLPIWGLVKAYIETVIDFVITSMPLFQEIFENVFNTIKAVWDTVLAPVFSFLKTAIEDIVNIVIQNLPWVQQVWQQVWDGISTFTSVVMGIIQNSIIPIFQVIIGWVQTNWPLIKEVINQVMNEIKFVVNLVLGWIKTFWNNWGSQIVATVTSIFNGIKTFIQGALNFIKGIINIVMGVIKGDWSRVWEGIKQVISGVWNAIKGIVQTAINIVKGVLQTAWGIISSAVSTVWNGIKSTIERVWNGIKSGVETAVNSVKSTVENIWNGIKGTTERVWNSIKSAIETPINEAKRIVGNVVDAIKGFFNFKISWPKIPVPHFGITPSGWKIGDLLKGSIPKLGISWHADGGIFTKPTVIGNHGFGEAGKEAILPISKLPGLLAPYFQRKGETTEKQVIITHNNTFNLENIMNLTKDKVEQIAEWLQELNDEKYQAIGGI